MNRYRKSHVGSNTLRYPTVGALTFRLGVMRDETTAMANVKKKIRHWVEEPKALMESTAYLKC